MSKTRLVFSKTGRAVWISHLDLMHTLQRAFSRSGIRLKYSEGFNPHPIMSIALPLSVGMESNCEILDIKCDNEVDITLLNRALPEGIEILRAYEAERKPSEIKWLEVEGYFEGNSPELLGEFFSREEIIISKRTKRGESRLDIKPMIKEISFSEGKLHALISAQEPTLSPQNLIDALSQNAPELCPGYAKFRRVCLYDRDMKVFE